MKKKIIFFFNVIYLVFLLQPSSSLEPNIFVQSTVNRASQILSDNISKNEKIEKLKVIAKDTVDIKGIGFYTLGKFRKEISDEQKNKYSKLFESYFLKILHCLFYHQSKCMYQV